MLFRTVAIQEFSKEEATLIFLDIVNKVLYRQLNNTASNLKD